ncbi:uncharacterized protein LOC119836377 [Zerene cesonia]|uniref:uncharacterized protein LOC119836377 n=1 Tax=Zerene cesonia TaxID=33412 RepID=UPI0018E57CDE|nr:uncharacterized protein LOC119836377 [Zerene cesonia]
MMQKENTDPEKITLLKDKQKEKKKKVFPSRPKYDQKSYDSSSTDRYRRIKQHKITVQGVREEKNEEGSEAFQGDKREAWWFKRGKKEAERKPDDTCSCVSCALKKLIGSEYMCVACLLVLFTVSVAVAFIMVFRAPVLETRPEHGAGKGLQLRKRQLNEGYDGNNWNTLSNSLPQYPGYMGSDLADTKLQGSSSLDNLDGISGDLSSVLGSEKLADSQNSDRLRDFYKKLIQTDAQIKRLKESLTHNYQTETDIKSISERFKRSMEDTIDSKNEFNSVKDKVHNNIGQYKDAIVYDVKELNKRGKRSRDNNTKLTGFVVQKEKYYVQYEPIVQRRNFPKCYHGHNGKYHEKKLKHPFYKNSQRLDEMLYESVDNGKTTIKDLAYNKNTRKPQSDSRYRIKNNDYFEKDEDYNDTPNQLNITLAKNLSELSTDYFENKQVNIPESTIESIFTQTKAPKDPNEKKFGFGRKLLQVNDEDEEALGYDDLKEVLADDQKTHDETDKQIDRIKRNNDDTPTNFIKYNPSPGVYNPNWKGPMPLYPDEINAMIKQAALHNLNIQVPVDTKETKIEKDKAERDITDTEYVEDYLDDKYSKLVNMAQAYSDYGVLDAKQDTNGATTKGLEKPEEGMKVFNGIRNGRTKKGGHYDPEGVRIEYKPGTVSQKNDVKCLLNSIRKHIRFVKPHKTAAHPVATHTKSTAVVDKVYTPAQTTDNLKAKSPSPFKESKKVIFTLKKPLRSLKSLDNEEVHIVKENGTNLAFGDFFAMMADFFFSMANVSGELKDNTTYNLSKESADKGSESVISFPMYDSEMIENIGHRSRVLMSIDDNITTSAENNKTVATLSNGTVANTTSATINNSNVTTTSDDKSTESNKTVVKRSIGSNFIFWNDLYDDDEYGMRVDYLDSVLRGKHAAKYDYKGALMKSKDWVQDKLKTMTDKIRDDINQKWKLVEDKKLSTLKPNPNMLPQKIVGVRRIRSIDNNNGEDDVRKTFAVLNANLKHVCKQAAEAVRNTRKVETRAENEEGTQATGLMQQLVRLMSDLVDIQVQQKTCAKLPPDLRDFLEWLTAPPENNPIVDHLPPLTEYSHMFPDGRYEKSTDFTYDLPTLTEDTHQDDRTECLGSIRAVQDLIQQYDGMTDEDKSKMAGVREYLENQLEFLNRKLNSLNEYDTFNYKKREVRNKRSLNKPRFRRLFNKHLFVKTPTPKTTLKANTKAKQKQKNDKHKKKGHKKGKNKEKLIAKGENQTVKTEQEKLREELKHLDRIVNNIDIATKEKTTNKKGFAEYNDDLNAAEDNDNGVYFNDKLDIINDAKVRNERNLRDVYFKALDEAKKTTVWKTKWWEHGDQRPHSVSELSAAAYIALISGLSLIASRLCRHACAANGTLLFVLALIARDVAGSN